MIHKHFGNRHGRVVVQRVVPEGHRRDEFERRVISKPNIDLLPMWNSPETYQVAVLKRQQRETMIKCLEGILIHDHDHAHHGINVQPERA